MFIAVLIDWNGPLRKHDFTSGESKSQKVSSIIFFLSFFKGFQLL